MLSNLSDVGGRLLKSVNMTGETEQETTEQPIRGGLFPRVTWGDILKFLGVMVLLVGQWTNSQAQISALQLENNNARDRITKIEAELTKYMPRELQAAHDQLVLQKLDSLQENVERLTRRFEK
jgi:hypothetical protein